MSLNATPDAGTVPASTRLFADMFIQFLSSDAAEDVISDALSTAAGSDSGSDVSQTPSAANDADAAIANLTSSFGQMHLTPPSASASSQSEQIDRACDFALSLPDTLGLSRRPSPARGSTRSSSWTGPGPAPAGSGLDLTPLPMAPTAANAAVSSTPGPAANAVAYAAAAAAAAGAAAPPTVGEGRLLHDDAGDDDDDDGTSEALALAQTAAAAAAANAAPGFTGLTLTAPSATGSYAGQGPLALTADTPVPDISSAPGILHGADDLSDGMHQGLITPIRPGFTGVDPEGDGHGAGNEDEYLAAAAAAAGGSTGPTDPPLPPWFSPLVSVSADLPHELAASTSFPSGGVTAAAARALARAAMPGTAAGTVGDAVRSAADAAATEASRRVLVVQAAWRVHVRRQRRLQRANQRREARAAQHAKAVAAGEADPEGGEGAEDPDLDEDGADDGDSEGVSAELGSPESASAKGAGLPLEGLLPVTTEVFQLPPYANRQLFERLLAFQERWGTTPVRAADQTGEHEDGDDPSLVSHATIMRFYWQITSRLDAPARLFYLLLPCPPPTAPHLRPIPRSILNEYFLANDQAAPLALGAGGDPDAIAAQAQAQAHVSASEAATEALVAAAALPPENPNDPSVSLGPGLPLSADSEAGLLRSVLSAPPGLATGTAEDEDSIEAGLLLPSEGPLPPLESKYLLRTFLTRSDFRPIMAEVLAAHPGLDFLSSAPDFQERYMQTVIARIFYAVNVAGDERLTLRELRRSNLPQRLADLAREEDINVVPDFFSYEHFYVIYCKFWELDTDHDMVLGPDDLVKYDDCGLTSRVLDRVLQGAGRPLRSGIPGRMGYEDFVTFFISEVDKASPVAQEYWFRCLDLDGDGAITAFEMEWFFDEQQLRIQAVSPDAADFVDTLCQLCDMINPAREAVFTRKDLRKSLMAPLFYDMLINLNKFVMAESRDVARIRHIHETPELSDWDRWASQCYYSLAGAEQAEEESVAQQQAAAMDLSQGLQISEQLQMLHSMDAVHGMDGVDHGQGGMHGAEIGEHGGDQGGMGMGGMGQGGMGQSGMGGGMGDGGEATDMDSDNRHLAMYGLRNMAVVAFDTNGLPITSNVVVPMGDMSPMERGREDEESSFMQ